MNWRKAKKLYKRKHRSWRNGSDRALRTMRRVCCMWKPDSWNRRLSRG